MKPRRGLGAQAGGLPGAKNEPRSWRRGSPALAGAGCACACSRPFVVRAMRSSRAALAAKDLASALARTWGAARAA